jgi:hypothetical protein
VLGPHSRRQSILTNQYARSKCRKDAFLSFQKRLFPMLVPAPRKCIDPIRCVAKNKAGSVWWTAIHCAARYAYAKCVAQERGLHDRLCCSKITMIVWRTFGCSALRSLVRGASRCIVQFSSAKPSLGSAIPTRVSAERQHCTVSLHLDSSLAFFILIDPGYSAKLRGDAHLACSRAGALVQPPEAQVMVGSRPVETLESTGPRVPRSISRHTSYSASRLVSMHSKK